MARSCARSRGPAPPCRAPSRGCWIRMRPKRGETLPDVVDLEKLFAEVAATAAPAAAEKGIAVVCDAGGLSAYAEPLMLARALANLLSNAVKFSPKGLVRAPRGAIARTLSVRVSVIDRGPGIAAGEVGSLFRKFTRLSPRPTGERALVRARPLYRAEPGRPHAGHRRFRAQPRGRQRVLPRPAGGGLPYRHSLFSIANMMSSRASARDLPCCRKILRPAASG